MKKAITLVVLMVVVVFSVVAQSDPFATKRFVNENVELSFRSMDSEGRAQASYTVGKTSNQYYYDFDDECLVLYDENGTLAEVFGYSFINEGSELRLFNEKGSFFDLKSDNGKTAGDVVLEAIDVSAQNFLLYGGSGAAIGLAYGGSVGAVIGLGVGGLLGVGKALVHDVLGWF